MFLLIVKILSYGFLIAGAYILFAAISMRSDRSAEGCLPIFTAIGLVLIGIWLAFFVFLP